MTEISNVHSITCVILLSGLCSWTRADFYTSISDMERLVDTHEEVINKINDYLRKEEDRLNGLKRYLDLYKKEQEFALKDVNGYVGNPINAFILIKRLTADLDDIEERTRKTTGNTDSYSLRQDSSGRNISFPTKQDLQGAANALERLGQLYRLNITDLAEGILNGVKYSSPMTASDCYKLGQAMYSTEEYESALAWMTEALRKYQNDFPYSFDRSDILLNIGYVHFMIGNTESAIKWSLEAIEANPNNTRAKENVDHYQKVINGEIEQVSEETSETSETNEDVLINPDYVFSSKVYEGLCRGELELPPNHTAKLSCRYLNDKPFLKLAPIKMEQRFIDPDIYVFHDVISDNEITQILDQSRANLARALVFTANSTVGETDYRISKSTFIYDHNSIVSERLTRRVADFTGLSMYAAEPLQVANYGIGGHYVAHFDFYTNDQIALLDDDDPYKTFLGNRIATIMFYMSDVEQGGATVFPKLGLGVFPKKGSALYWPNLHPSGEGNMATTHSACPVLLGNKWVCNKWIHQAGHELTRPCNLEFQPEGVQHQYPTPVPKAFYGA